MWLLLTSALAGPPILDGPVEPYPTTLPSRTSEPVRWARADMYGARASRAGAYLTVGAVTVGSASLGLMLLQDEAGPFVSGTGGALFVVAAPAAALGPAVLLGGSLRSRRALKERGVRVSALPGAFGWALYGVTPLLISVVDDQGAFPILSYSGAVALGFLQTHINMQARGRAGLPDPLRAETSPVGSTAGTDRAPPEARARLRVGVAPAPTGAVLLGSF